MDEIRHIRGHLVVQGARFAVVAARFNRRIVERLTQGAMDCLLRHGARPEHLLVVEVPGAREIPLALEELAKGGRYDGLIALGAVIRGETPHFDYVCAECSQGIGRVSNQYRVPVGFGVLTCDNSAQAEERADGKAGNKGWDAALAVIEMVDVLTQLRGLGQPVS